MEIVDLGVEMGGLWDKGVEIVDLGVEMGCV